MRVDRAVTDDAKVPEGTTGAEAGNAVVAKSVPKLELLPSRQFPEWLAEQGVSLGFTTLWLVKTSYAAETLANGPSAG